MFWSYGKRPGRTGSGLLRVVMLIGVLLPAACAETQLAAHLASGSGSAGHYKVGRPYQVRGVWYTPQEDFAYDETGIASWYGPGFHGRATANGERFDENLLTAAHKTLQLPAIARVTNIQNGRSVVLRINDRGPFVAGRIIDLSKQAAEALGFRNQGTATVRVQILAQESLQVAQAAGRTGGGGVLAQRPATPAPQAAPQVASVAPTPAPRTVVPVSVSAAQPAYAPAAPAAMPTQIVSSVAPAAVGYYYLQSLTFFDIGSAEYARGRLQTLGPASIDSRVSDGGVFHTVRVGPFATLATASNALASATLNGVTGVQIVSADG